MNPFTGRSQCAARAARAMVAIATLSLAVGCGFGGGGNSGGGGGGGNNGFSNASLNGQYAYTLRGFGLLPGSLTQADFFVEGGFFTADGNGHLTAGNDDLVQNSTLFSDSMTGVYGINSDGSGDIRFDFAGGSITLRITMSDASHFYIEQEDGFGTSSGSGEKQDSTMLSTTPSGTFVSRSHDLGISATMARLAAAGGSLGGSYYVLQSGGAQFTGPVVGTIAVPINGKGTINYTLNGSTTHTIFYYVVSSSKFRMLDVTPGILSVGQGELQSAAAFSNSSLSGSYAFGSSGETAFADGIHTVGVLSSDGGGNITGGNFDSVLDGVVSSNVAMPVGTYTVDADGFGSITDTGNDKVVWMVSPSRGYFVALGAADLEDGTLDKQSGTFSNTSLKGQSAFFMDGFDASQAPAQFKDRVGTLTPNGSGALSIGYTSSFFDPNSLLGGSQPNGFAGSYSVSSTGRATAQLNGFTNNMVFYLVSDNTGYFLQADSNVDMAGAFTQQTAP